MELAINQIIVTVIGTAVGGVIGFLIGSLRRFSKIEKAKMTISRVSAERHIRDDYQKYVIDKHKMTINAYENLIEEYEALQILGGGPSVDAYMEELKQRKPYLVVE